MRLLFWIGSILIRHDVRLIGAVLTDDFSIQIMSYQRPNL